MLSAAQALLVAKAGATFLSPFIGRIDDIGYDGMDLIREIRQIYDNYAELKTEILAASIRTSAMSAMRPSSVPMWRPCRPAS